MIRVFLSLLNALSDRKLALKNPVLFARSLGVSVGDNVKFYGVSKGMFGSEPWMIRIGSNSHITAFVQFITHDGGVLVLRKEVPDLEWSAPIIVGNDVYIGIGSTIMPGVTIGNRCIIGAGTIVTKSIPDNCVVAGIPGKIIKSTDEYLTQMRAKSLKCGHLVRNEKDLVLKEIYREFANRNW